MNYRDQIRATAVQKNPGKLPPSDFAIERSIIRNWKHEWSVNGSPYDTSWTDHVCAYAKIVLPNIDHHEFFVRQVRSVEDTYYVERRKIINWIGSRSSGKTDSFATLGHILMSVWPEFTRAFFAAPYKTAAESVGWGRMKTRAKQMQQNPMFKGVQSLKDKIIYYDGEESGYMDLMTVDKVGKLQGAKSLDPTKGFLMVFCDEVALFPSQALLDIIENIMENDNLLIFTGCNFRDVQGLEGKLCHPEVGSYSDLDIDHDQEWRSRFGSKTWRFDGYLSPNILAGKVIYPYLLKPDTVATSIRTHGERGPKVLEQIRSFPNTNLSDFYVTTEGKIKSSGAYNDFTYAEAGTEKVAFCDPGFGGDPCKIGCFQFAKAKIQTSDGEWFETQIFEPVGEIRMLKVAVGLEADTAWVNRIERALGESGSEAKGLLGVYEGNDVEVELQIAVQCHEFLTEMGVERSAFGFDGSLRANIVQTMVALLGPSIQAFDYNARATGRPVFNIKVEEKDGKTRPKRADEEYFNYNSELYFAFGTLVQAGQLRGAELIKTAISQICGRRWSYSGKTKKIQPKEEYKGENNGVSPDDADVLISALEIARKRGFSILADKKPSAVGNVRGMLNAIMNSPLTKKVTARKLRTR